MKTLIISILISLFSCNVLADTYQFDYAVIDNQKVTTVSAPNIQMQIKNSNTIVVTYSGESVILNSHDGYEYKGYGKNGVMVISNKVKGVFPRITIGANVNWQLVMLIYKRI